MNDAIEIKKSEVENYVVEWDSHKNYLYLAVKVVRVFRKNGEITRRKYKNMVTSPGIDLALPASLQKRQLKEVVKTMNDLIKAIKTALKDPPKKKVEF